MLNERIVNRIGWFASLTAMLMFSSYIDQIRLNLEGNTGSVILPMATILNCTAWVSYSLLKSKKDWPIFACNMLGVIVAGATAITAVV